jgi:hypothetical protein
MGLKVVILASRPVRAEGFVILFHFRYVSGCGPLDVGLAR